ncbi:WD40/YVTN/BNR-like repeat-containing protein [Pseudomonas arsenicoxydans]|uniref:Glycosyl hydrolase n=1 Tax=Pseudomonas arsenicoxydans TaxID=702115 RepID=A0A502H237_9PSED|nr:YCF48-related protein [Pseudomonas arsenicoxydans]TPG67762.1 glycosyl hydrolase [Pseudomonas arsenicoxydans]
MNAFRWITLAALGVVLAVPFTRTVIAAEFVDPLSSPAVPSEKAIKGMFTGLATAGKRLVAVGQRGHIFYSDDDGVRWHQAQVPVSSDLVAVQFPSSTQGWAVGHDGVVLHSDDKGETWKRQLDGRQVGHIMLEHYRQQAVTDEALLADAQRMIDEGADKPFLDVWFANEKTGYIVGAFNLIFRTEDGGQTWLPMMDRTDNPGALNLYGMRAIGDDLFIVGEQGLVLKLEPASQRFVNVPTPYSGSYFGLTGTPGAVLVYGLRGNVYRSVDHGANWEKVELGLSSSITASTVTADGRIILVSQAGHVLVSDDDGVSFTQKPQERLGPAAAVQAVRSGSVVVAGAQGLRQLPYQ